MNWTVIHNYFSLIKGGVANKLECPSCLFPLVSLSDSIGQPTLWCPSCNSTYSIGTKLYNHMKNAVEQVIGE